MTTNTAAEIITRLGFVEGVLAGLSVVSDPDSVRLAVLDQARDCLGEITAIVRKEAGIN